MTGASSGETITRLEQFQAPYGREITLENVEYESGMRILRMRIREGHRFTIIDLDPDSASQLGSALGDWARAEPQEAN